MREESSISVCTVILDGHRQLTVVVQVTGWAVFGVGVWIHVYRETFLYAILLRDNPTDPVLVLDDISLILIIIGGVIVTISFLGCWGACTESVCFLAFVSIQYNS